MRRFRVAHVITRLCNGGAQENTFHSVRLADRDRFEVDLISGPTNGSEGSMEETVERSGVTIQREPALVREISPLNDLKALQGLTKRFKEKRYDIVHTHTSKAGVLGRLAAKRSATPIVVHTPHGNIFDGYFSPWKTRLFVKAERAAAKCTDRLVELTAGGVDEYLAQGIGTRSQYTVIFSGVDISPYAHAIEMREATRAALGVGPGDFLVGGVGRLEPVKGFTYFIAAAQRVAEADAGVHFIQAGQGSLETELREQAAPLGDRMQFLGRRDDVPDLMAAMDLLVVPSLNEGMGRVILEAGAAGCAVIATNVGGMPDIVQDGVTGVLVPPKRAGEIAEAVLALRSDPPRLQAMGAAARRFVMPNFGLDRMVMRIEAMYEELIEDKRLDA